MSTISFAGFEVPESVYPEGKRAQGGRILNAVLGSLLVAPAVIMGASETVVTPACNAKLAPAAVCAANTALQHAVVDVASIIAERLPDFPAPVVRRPVNIG